MTEPEPAPARLSALDGLRGVAALVVLLSHVLVASSPTLAGAFLIERPDVRTWSAHWWLLETPLQIVWAGHSAVVVFFVLSGFVLALPLAGGSRFDARRYYPRRLLRLYLPVWAAIVLAALLHAVVERPLDPAASWWLNAHTQPMGVREAAENAALVHRPGGWAFTSVLWSLRWEVLFSLALPLYVLGTALAARRGLSWLAAAAALFVMTAGDRASLIYLPCFLLGTLLAYERPRMERLGTRLAESGALRVLLPVAAVLLLTARWWGDTGARAAQPLVATGAALAVALAIAHGPMRAALERRPAQWVGRRSFSLYLVHEPLVVTAAFLLGGDTSTVLLAAVSLPLALGVAHLFFGLVERPSLRLSRRAGGAAPG